MTYNHKPWLSLYFSLPVQEPACVGRFSIVSKTINPYTTDRGYDETQGKMCSVKYGASFRITTLEEDSHIWMSTSQFELAGLVNPVAKARARVLTCGLGLGIFPYLAALKDEVESVTVVEREASIATLVTSQMTWPGNKVSVVVSDLYDYVNVCERTGACYDFIYLDTWQGLLGPLEDAMTSRLLVEPIRAPEGETFLWMQELIDRVLDKLPKTPTKAKPFRFNAPPCLVCGKIARADFAGLCMDCADILGISDIFITKTTTT